MFIEMTDLSSYLRYFSRYLLSDMERIHQLQTWYPIIRTLLDWAHAQWLVPLIWKVLRDLVFFSYPSTMYHKIFPINVLIVGAIPNKNMIMLKVVMPKNNNNNNTYFHRRNTIFFKFSAINLYVYNISYKCFT